MLPGLPADKRYRCSACGNLTRFDVVTTEQVRRFWHAELSGAGTVEDIEYLSVTVEQATCHWCASTDVEIVDTPGAAI